MRKILFIAILVLPGIGVFSQKSKPSAGLYTSFFGAGSPIGWHKGGSIHYDVTHSFRLGAEYNQPLNKWLKINAGIEYGDYEITVSFAPPDILVSKGHLQFISLPVYLSADLLKYFFFTFGTVIDFPLKNNIMDKVGGFGITGGAGIKYDFKNNLRVFVHPFFQLHGLSMDHNLLTSAFRTGISYRF